MENFGLCGSCAHSLIIEGELDTLVICARIPREFEVPFKVLKCNSYEHGDLPALQEMEAIAWYVRPRERRKNGFHK
jgi:hypothetical protein